MVNFLLKGGDLKNTYGQNKCRDFLQDTHLQKKVAQEVINNVLRFPHYNKSLLLIYYVFSNKAGYLKTCTIQD